MAGNDLAEELGGLVTDALGFLTKPLSNIFTPIYDAYDNLSNKKTDILLNLFLGLSNGVVTVGAVWASWKFDLLANLYACEDTVSGYTYEGKPITLAPLITGTLLATIYNDFAKAAIRAYRIDNFGAEHPVLYSYGPNAIKNVKARTIDRISDEKIKKILKTLTFMHRSGCAPYKINGKATKSLFKLHNNRGSKIQEFLNSYYAKEVVKAYKELKIKTKKNEEAIFRDIDAVYSDSEIKDDIEANIDNKHNQKISPLSSAKDHKHN